ncbi:MAG: hypothetical protein HXS48_09690 [Theionarchaea archaeon]|nr:hypothetical protein [Theionarchaea archaeon]
MSHNHSKTWGLFAAYVIGVLSSYTVVILTGKSTSQDTTIEVVTILFVIIMGVFFWEAIKGLRSSRSKIKKAIFGNAVVMIPSIIFFVTDIDLYSKLIVAFLSVFCLIFVLIFGKS